MITGVHAILYSRHAQALRDVLANVLGLPSVDAGGGWPIFAAPPTELAVHPTEDEPEHEIYLMCDDINATLQKLRARGIESSDVADRGWGLLSTLTLRGGETIGIYEPRHPQPHPAGPYH
ncbi:MAG TPA: hypothetical protein VFA29_10200 [Candidatus Baltobacteraceae bacterium]|nr:hypothetical protein [Candidatus Baltobacteraceae bacterium]